MGEQPARKGRWLDYLLLAAPSFSTPMLLWAENYVGIGHPERLIFIGAAVWTVSVLALRIARLLGASRVTSLIGVWVAVYVFMRGGFLLAALGYVAALASVGGAIAIALFLISRRTSGRWIVIASMASLLLVAEVLLAWYASWASYGEDVSLPPPVGLDIALDTTPDIVLIVPDAYVGLEGLQRYFGVAEPRWSRSLSERGFQVPEIAYSPYTSTAVAMASMLDMSYPIDAGPGMSKATTEALYRRIGGDNEVVRMLARNGYKVTMIESGWSGSICGAAIDTCISSPFLDEATDFALERTMLRPFIRARFGYAFSVGALNTMAWLRENLSRMTSDDQPDLVLAHLEVPHPPFFLDAQCNLDTSSGRGGVTLQRAGSDVEERMAMYRAQAACVDVFIEELVDGISEEAVVIVAADHGSDLHHQLVIDPHEWSFDATRERLNIMFAMRAGDCLVSEPVILTHVFRDLFDCLSGESLPPLETRLFRYTPIIVDGTTSPVVELSEAEVAALLSRRGMSECLSSQCLVDRRMPTIHPGDPRHREQEDADLRRDHRWR